jgi:hypothetical protein
LKPELGVIHVCDELPHVFSIKPELRHFDEQFLCFRCLFFLYFMFYVKLNFCDDLLEGVAFSWATYSDGRNLGLAIVTVTRAFIDLFESEFI